MGPLPPVAVTPPRGPLRPEDYLNVRDALSSFVGKGYWSTINENAQSVYSYLRGQLGPDLARRMLIQMTTHNQRPDMVALSPEQRLQRFYDMGSKDAEVNDLIMRTGQLGQGPIAGARESPNNLITDMLDKQWYKNGPTLGAGALSPVTATMQKLSNLR